MFSFNLSFKNLCFFSVYYLGIRNRKSFLLNITAILLAMLIILITLSFSKYLKNYESQSLLNTGDANLITIEIKNLNKNFTINSFNFWNKLAGTIHDRFSTDFKRTVKDVYPIHIFQAYMTMQHKGKKEELPVIIKSLDEESFLLDDLEFIKEHSGAENINGFTGLIVDEDIIKLFDNPDTVETIDLSVQINTSTLKEMKNIPIFAIAKNINHQYIYINSKKLWKMISSVQKDSYIKHPCIEILTDKNDTETINNISFVLKTKKDEILELVEENLFVYEKHKNEKKNYHTDEKAIENIKEKISVTKTVQTENVYSETAIKVDTQRSTLTNKNSKVIIEDIFDKNRDLIRQMQKVRKGVFIIGIICAGLIFIFIVNNVIRTIEAKKKEIGFLMAGFTSINEISIIFLGNMLFCSIISFAITILINFILFSIYPDGFFHFFHQPSWPSVLLGLMGIVLFTIVTCLIFIHRISTIDPIQIIQNVSD